MHCAFTLTSVPLHPHGSHYLAKTVGKVGERVPELALSLIFLALLQIVHTVPLTVALHSPFPSPVFI